MDERVDRPEAEYAPQTHVPLVRQRRRRRWPWLLLLLLLAILAIAWFWTHHTTRTAQRGGRGYSAQSAPQPVGSATIAKGDIRIILNELGTVTSLDTVTVYTQINGQLIDVGFQEGQIVKKGDFLAQIDPRPYQAALDQAQGTLAHDQGLLDQAKADLKRYQTLGRQDSIAQQQLEDQKYLVQQYTGTVAADQGTVENDKVNLAYCHIVSPITGQVGLRQVDPGNYVQSSNTTGIVVITEMQPMSVLFSVPQQEVPAIIKRMRSGATLPVTAYDQANTTLLATGQLATVDNQINTTTGTLQMRAMFSNQNDELYPNQFVNARLLENTLKDVVRVPVPAVLRGAPGTYVYVINANNTVSVRPVKLGPTDDGYEQVISGLQPGEKVVTDGTDRLSDGVKVTIPATTANAAAGGAAAGTAPATGQTGAATQTKAAATQPNGPAPQTNGAATQTNSSAPAGQDAGKNGQPQHRQHKQQQQSQ